MLKKIFNVFLAHKTPAITLLLALVAYIFSHSVTLFEYNRAAIVDFELWRLLTGHFFHTNGYHLLLNLVALILLWAIHGQFYRGKTYVSLTLFCALFISGCLFYCSSISLYVGLSGILHGVFLWGALKDIENREKTGYLLLIGIMLKIAHEYWSGANQELETLINANVAIEAHLYGAVAGFVFYLIQRLTSPSPIIISSSNRQ